MCLSVLQFKGAKTFSTIDIKKKSSTPGVEPLFSGILGNFLDAAGHLFLDIAFLDGVDRLLVVVVDRTATAVVTVGRMQASLLHVPLRYLDVLIYIHVIAPCSAWVMLKAPLKMLFIR